jgi:hypothetical protein
MSRKLFFREFEVVKLKRKHGGVELPADGILLKLRKPGHRPVWRFLDREEFRRERHFRER